jgi:hypothetical protein
MGSDSSSAETSLSSADVTDPKGEKVVPSTVYSRGAFVLLSITKNWKDEELVSLVNQHAEKT